MALVGGARARLIVAGVVVLLLLRLTISSGPAPAPAVAPSTSAAAAPPPATPAAGKRTEATPGMPWLMKYLLETKQDDLPPRALNFWEIQSKQLVPTWVDRALFKRISMTRGSSMLVVVTNCCNLFHLTRRVLINLALIRDVVDVVVVDDASSDESLDTLRDWDIRVLPANPDHPTMAVGLSRVWNTAWNYFLSNPRWKTLYLLNNDILVDHHTFDYLDMVLLDPKYAHTPIVVGPMTTKRGLGEMSAPFLPHQDIQQGRFGPSQEQVPRSLLEQLPSSMGMLNIWLQQRVDVDARVPPSESSAPWLLGFLLGFKRHPSIEHAKGEIVPNGLINIGQEENLFQRAIAVAVRNVFVFHDKGTTMQKVGARNDMQKIHKESEVIIFETERK